MVPLFECPLFGSPLYSCKNECSISLNNFVTGVTLKDDHDTGSIITMTSDERVQIYVPSPLETTPYNTITRHVEQVGILTILLLAMKIMECYATPIRGCSELRMILQFCGLNSVPLGT